MMLDRLGRQSHVLAAGLVVAAALVAVGWIDYRATRRELVNLLRDQASSLRDTVAVAVHARRAAAAQAEQEFGARLLDNARLLRALDERGGLDQAVLDEIVSENGLFRVTLFNARGERERTSSLSPGAGPGPGPGPVGGGGGFGAGPRQGVGGGAGPRQGAGSGAGGASADILDRLLKGLDAEALTGLHSGWGSGVRAAAAVRRPGGGVILLNADATAIERIERSYSFDELLSDIAHGTAEIAYIVLETANGQFVQGLDIGQLPASPSTTAGDAPAVSEREVTAAGRPVLELAGPIDLGDLDVARLRVGMRLDGVRRAERQTLVRLAASLSVALVLTLVAIGFLGLRRQYGVLSARHEAAQQALRRRDRLTAMGELASTVAHEVRNPLNAIGMAARRLTREFTAPSGPSPDPADAAELKDLLGVVEGETRRIDAIVQQFLEFARPPTLVRRAVDLERFAEEVVDAHRALAAARLVTLDLAAAGAGEASVDASQLRQAVDNLVRNAIEATPDGGIVRVRASRAGRGHIIEVEDSGPGIAADDLPRIFDLYFTTKAGGTGVGLAVTHQVVTAHGGTIEVESQPGEGTRMTVRLPLDEESRG
jgi:signal transduction histidine kinase